MEHRLEVCDGGGLFLGQRHARMEMREQHHERVLDPAELLAVAGDVRQNLSLDCGVARLADRDVDDAELASDRRHEPWCDRLNYIPG